MKDNSSVLFSSNLILWTKIVHWSKILELLSGWVKIHKIPVVIFETMGHFFFKLHIMLQCHERSLFCTFLAGTLYYFDEGSPSKCQISDLRFHQICTWIGSFCWKYIKFQLKITEELFLMTLKIDAKFEEKLICVSKLTRIWWILIRALKSLKNLHFDWSFMWKACNVWSKKVQRSYLSWHSRVMQNWLVVWKITQGI